MPADRGIRVWAGITVEGGHEGMLRPGREEYWRVLAVSEQALCFTVRAFTALPTSFHLDDAEAGRLGGLSDAIIMSRT